mmetsp:Transcript_17972/g.36514  ORF Transcript_17972/g.36514 Transcript_17972/m.36514 type:complete len:251 (-) Transcript_17972:271-1023(-)
MADHFEAAVLGEVKAVAHGLDRVASIGVPRHVLVHRLHPDLDPGAPVREHLAKVRPEAVVGPSLDGDAYALGAALLAEADRLGEAAADVPAERVVEVRDKVLLVLLVEAEESPPHDYKLHLVRGVPQRPQLRHPTPRLRVRVVAGADGAHGGGLVAGVGLGAVLEVAVWATRAVDAHVSGVLQVRAAVRLAHNSHHSDATRASNRLSLQKWRQCLPIFLWYGAQHIHDLWYSLQPPLLRHRVLEGGEVQC